MHTRTVRALSLIAILVTSTLSQSAIACKIEDWSYKEKAGHLYLTGATTCQKGRLTIRVYDGKTDKFLASDSTYIEGYAFQTYIDSAVPSRISIKYHIE